jgi:hypothetical protein
MRPARGKAGQKRTSRVRSFAYNAIVAYWPCEKQPVSGATTTAEQALSIANNREGTRHDANGDWDAANLLPIHLDQHVIRGSNRC